MNIAWLPLLLLLLLLFKVRSAGVFYGSHIRSLSIEISISMPLNVKTMISHIFFISFTYLCTPLCVLNVSFCCDCFAFCLKPFWPQISRKSVTTKLCYTVFPLRIAQQCVIQSLLSNLHFNET